MKVARRAKAKDQHGGQLPAATEGGRWVVELPGDRGDQTHENNAAERALSQTVIQRKISHGAQSRQGEICRSQLL